MTRLPCHLDPKGEDPPTSPLKIAVIREEFVALTGSPLIAALLNQLVYWSQRVADFDQFLVEEQSPPPKDRASPCHGWFYKTAHELIDETLLCVSLSTFRRYLSFLITKGWVQKRSNPQNKWDRTIQYRVNWWKLNQDLQAKKYRLSGFSEKQIVPDNQNDGLHEKEAQKPCISRRDKIGSSKVQNASFDTPKSLPSRDSKVSFRKNKIITCNTETTTKTTNKEHTPRTRDQIFFNEVLKLWKIHVGQDVNLTKVRKTKLESLLSFYFQKDLNQWETFCGRIKASPFLMGHGSKGWHVSLDWILNEANLLKVLEGNFDDPKVLKKKKDVSAKRALEQKRDKLLASIKDPQWRQWCTELRDYLNTFELEDLREVRFDEFDGRLVVVASSNPKALSRVESLRFLFIPIIQKTFPKARNIITQRDIQKKQDLNVNNENPKQQRNKTC